MIDEKKMLKLDALDRVRVEMDLAYRQVRRRATKRAEAHIEAQLAGLVDATAALDPAEAARKALDSLSVQLLEAGHVPEDG